MRVVEQKIKDAIAQQKTVRTVNTKCIYDISANRCSVYLFGNLIAIINYNDNNKIKSVRYTFARWQSVTTISRLRHCIPYTSISCIKGQYICNNLKVNSIDWIHLQIENDVVILALIDKN